MDDSKKLPNNVPGKYHTTEECDGCAYCAAVAPENFEFDKPTNTYFIARQPADSEEEELVLEAKQDCPVDAIRIEEKNANAMTIQDENNGYYGS